MCRHWMRYSPGSHTAWAQLGAQPRAAPGHRWDIPGRGAENTGQPRSNVQERGLGRERVIPLLQDRPLVSKVISASGEDSMDH